MRGDSEADMAAAAAEIEHARVALSRDQRGERFQVGSLRMNRAAEIGARLRAELRVDQGFEGFFCNVRTYLRCNPPPVIGWGMPVVPGKLNGRPARARSAR